MHAPPRSHPARFEFSRFDEQKTPAWREPPGLPGTESSVRVPEPAKRSEVGSGHARMTRSAAWRLRGREEMGAVPDFFTAHHPAATSPEIFDQHDVGLQWFHLAEENRSAVGGDAQGGQPALSPKSWIGSTAPVAKRRHWSEKPASGVDGGMK